MTPEQCVPYKKDGIGFTRKGDTVYAIQFFESESFLVEDIVWIPYTGAVSEITALGGDEVLSFEKEQGGCHVKLKKKEYIEAPIARVFYIR